VKRAHRKGHRRMILILAVLAALIFVFAARTWRGAPQAEPLDLTVAPEGRP